MLLYKKIVAFLLIIIFYCNTVQYIFIREISAFNQKHAIILMMAMAVPFLFEKGKLIKLIHNSFFKWVCLFQLIITINFFFTILFFQVEYGDTIMQVFRRLTLSSIIFILVLIIMEDDRVFTFSKKMLVASVIIGCGINLYDLLTFDKMIFSPFIGRAAGFYINPNVANVVLNMGLILTITFVPKKLRLWYIIIVGIGIALTLSRSGVAIYILFFFLTIALKVIEGKGTFITLFFIFIFMFLGFQTFISNASKGIQDAVYNSDALLTRIEQITNPSMTTITEDTRFENLTYYLNIYQKSPLIGKGIGSSTYYSKFYWQNTSSHNQFLHFMVEFGILGFLIVTTVLLAAALINNVLFFSKEWILFAFTYLLFCMVSHNLFDHFNFIFCYAFLSRLNQEKYLLDKNLIK